MHRTVFSLAQLKVEYFLADPKKALLNGEKKAHSPPTSTPPRRKGKVQ